MRRATRTGLLSPLQQPQRCHERCPGAEAETTETVEEYGLSEIVNYMVRRAEPLWYVTTEIAPAAPGTVRNTDGTTKGSGGHQIAHEGSRCR